MQVLCLGYCLPFVSWPRLSPVPFPLPSYSPSSARELACSAAVQDLRSKDAIEPGFYSRLFVTPKVTGGWRPVIDLWRFNCFVHLTRFRMKTSASVLQSLGPAIGWFLGSSRRLPPSPCPSGFAEVSALLSGFGSFPVQGP